MNAANVNTGPQWPAPSRPGWPIGSATAEAEKAATLFAEACTRAPTTAVDRLASEYIARKGKASFQSLVYALAAKAGVSL